MYLLVMRQLPCMKCYLCNNQVSKFLTKNNEPILYVDDCPREGQKTLPVFSDKWWQTAHPTLAQYAKNGVVLVDKKGDCGYRPKPNDEMKFDFEIPDKIMKFDVGNDNKLTHGLPEMAKKTIKVSLAK